VLLGRDVPRGVSVPSDAVAVMTNDHDHISWFHTQLSPDEQTSNAATPKPSRPEHARRPPYASARRNWMIMAEHERPRRVDPTSATTSTTGGNNVSRQNNGATSSRTAAVKTKSPGRFRQRQGHGLRPVAEKSGRPCAHFRVGQLGASRSAAGTAEATLFITDPFSHVERQGAPDRYANTRPRGNDSPNAMMQFVP
jgi:hypothetical protein